jgi:hypothetical protein
MTRALVWLTLAPSFAAFSQGISTKNVYLPSDLAAQLKTDLVLVDGCAPLTASIVTAWLRLSKDGPLVVRIDGRGCLAGVTNTSILLYVRGSRGWRKILDATGDRMYSLPTRHHEWRDLDLVQHVNAFISTHLVFRFDGSIYTAAVCQSVDETIGGPLHPRRQMCKLNGRALSGQP